MSRARSRFERGRLNSSDSKVSHSMTSLRMSHAQLASDAASSAMARRFSSRASAASAMAPLRVASFKVNRLPARPASAFNWSNFARDGKACGLRSSTHSVPIRTPATIIGAPA